MPTGALQLIARRVGYWLRASANWLLLIAIFLIVLVEALRAYPEVIPFGAILGNIMLAFAYAYAGAWVFNEVLIERPRRRARAAAYDTSWRRLCWLANTGTSLLDDLEPYAYGWQNPRPISDDELLDFERHIWSGDQISRWTNTIVNPGERLRDIAVECSQTLDHVLPFLHLFEDQVSAELMSFPPILKHLSAAPLDAEETWISRPDKDGTWSRFPYRTTLEYSGITSLVESGARLRAALLASQGSNRDDAHFIDAGYFTLGMGANPEPWQPRVEIRDGATRLHPRMPELEPAQSDG